MTEQKIALVSLIDHRNTYHRNINNNEEEKEETQELVETPSVTNEETVEENNVNVQEEKGKSAPKLIASSSSLLPKNGMLIINLPDPFDGKNRQYLYSPSTSSKTTTKLRKNKEQNDLESLSLSLSSSSMKVEGGIFEIQSVPRCDNKGKNKESSYQSFFVGNRVVSRGNLHLINRIDPLFFVLYSLSASFSSSSSCSSISTVADNRNDNDNSSSNSNSNNWQPKDQLETNLHSSLKCILSKKQWEIICETRSLPNYDSSSSSSSDNEDDDTTLYRLNNDLIMKWLHIKIKRVEETLTEQTMLRKKRREDWMETKTGCKGESNKIRNDDGNVINNGGGSFSSNFRPVGLTITANTNTTIKDNDDEKKDKEETIIKEHNSSNDKSTSTQKQSLSTTLLPSSLLPKLDSSEYRTIKLASLQVVCQYLSPYWRDELLKFHRADKNTNKNNNLNSSKISSVVGCDQWTEDDLWNGTIAAAKRRKKMVAAAAAAKIAKKNTISGNKRKGNDDDDDNNDHLTSEYDNDVVEVTPPPSQQSHNEPVGMDGADELLRLTMGGSSSNVGDDDDFNTATTPKKGPGSSIAMKKGDKSMGLKRLAKVNTKGMKSMLSFFGGGGGGSNKKGKDKGGNVVKKQKLK